MEDWYYLRCGHYSEPNPIWGSGSGQQLSEELVRRICQKNLSEELQAPLLGQFPIDPRICSGGDTGTPLTLTSPDCAPALVFHTSLLRYTPHFVQFQYFIER